MKERRKHLIKIYKNWSSSCLIRRNNSLIQLEERYRPWKKALLKKLKRIRGINYQETMIPLKLTLIVFKGTTREAPLTNYPYQANSVTSSQSRPGNKRHSLHPNSLLTLTLNQTLCPIPTLSHSSTTILLSNSSSSMLLITNHCSIYLQHRSCISRLFRPMISRSNSWSRSFRRYILYWLFSLLIF
jgi:hypothetical protein